MGRSAQGSLRTLNVSISTIASKVVGSLGGRAAGSICRGRQKGQYRVFNVNTASTVTVLIVDDYDLFRTGLATLLGEESDIEVVAQASGGRMGIRLARELRPDVILMDLRMPDVNGIDAIRAIVDDQPEARVVALTVLADDAAVTEAMAAGACGFLAKDSPAEDVASALRAAARGSAWLAPRAAEVVLSSLRHAQRKDASPTSQHEGLSPRELDVLRLIARGLANAEIAAILNISPRTVKNHVSKILEKLGLTSRLHAAIYAVHHGLE